MDISVNKSKIGGTLEIPGSKSHTIRAIAIALLAEGASTIKKPLFSLDTLSCLEAASTLGGWIKRGDDTVWRIDGVNGNLLQPARGINLGNSGTGLSFFTALSALCNITTTFDGDSSLRTRKMAPLLGALSSLGAETTSKDGFCPLTVKGPIHSGVVTVDGKSSQYASALLIAAPLLSGETVVNIENACEIPYLLMTLEWLKRQNIDLSAASDLSSIRIKGGQKYDAFTATIPGDFSTAGFGLLAAAVTGGELQLRNLDFNDTQGDKAVFDFFREMGVKLTFSEGAVTVKGPKKLKAFDLDINATPDALPILAVAGACAEGKSFLRNVPQARMKETDRIAVMARELGKMGVETEEFEDGLAVTGTKPHASEELDSHGDHRIAMALSIAGMAAEGRSVIANGDCAEVTYPSFLDDFAACGCDILRSGV